MSTIRGSTRILEKCWRATSTLSLLRDLKGSRAWQAFYAGKTAWLARLPKHTSEWLAWLIGLPQVELIDLLTLCAAATLNAMVSHDAKQEVDAIAEAVGLDMADWWEPTAEGYLSHVPKAQIAKALKEAGPDIVDDGIGDMKKEVLVVEAASRLAGKRWLPVSLRPRKVA